MLNKFLSSVANDLKTTFSSTKLSSFNNGLQVVKHFFYYFSSCRLMYKDHSKLYKYVPK